MLLLLGQRYGLAAAERLCGRRPCKAVRKHGGAGGVARVTHVSANIRCGMRAARAGGAAACCCVFIAVGVAVVHTCDVA